MTKTVITESGETIRINLPAPVWTGHDKYGTGVTLNSIFVSPRARRLVTETYSIWDDGHGRCQGTAFSLIEDAGQINRLAEEYPDVQTALESAGMLVSEDL